LTPLARAGGDVIFRAWTPRSLRVLRYEPASDRWHVGAEAPCRLRHGSDTQTVWIGDRLVAPCGADGLQISDPTSGSRQWTTVTPGRSALNTRAASATAWSGRELIVWSGWAFRRFNPTPPDGASLRLRR
jgi:hypothetical protein